MASFVGVMKTIIPWIGAAATSGVPGLVGMAANTIGGIVQKKLSADPEEIANAVAGATDPVSVAAMKKADQDFSLQMQALGFNHEDEIARLAEQDRESARDRQKAIKDKVPAILALSVTLGFFALLGFVAFHGVNPNSERLIDTMTGIIGGAWVTVFTYYFGSSASSAAKNDPAYINAMKGNGK